MMKYSNIACFLGLAALVSSCADFNDTTSYKVDKPESIANTEYLNDYQPLKTYIDAAKSPNFKLAAAVSGSEFADRYGSYALACSNFSQAVPSGDFMHSKCVGNDGSLSTDIVRKVGEAAELGGVEAYGHAIVSNTEQNTTYLNAIVANAVAALSEDDKIIDLSDDFSTIDAYKYDVLDGFTPTVEDGMLSATIKNKKNKYYLAQNLKTIPGMKYEYKIMIRGSKEVNLPLQIGDSELGTSNQIKVNLYTEWSEINVSSVADGENGYLMVDPGNLKLTIDVKYVIIKHQRELTAEEQTQLFENELNRWIAAIMNSSEGRISYWTLVNDPLASDGDNGEGYLPLEDKNNGAKGNFYWGEILGENYVAQASKLAKDYYAEAGGQGQLVLYANDKLYNEATLDLHRAESLVYWIKKWQNAGAQIDGISTPLHISYTLGSQTSEIEQYIGKLLEVMTSSGKLVRISEFDINVYDANGNAIATTDITLDQQKSLSDFYNRVVKLYLNKVPGAQQGGICVWNILDNSAPVGLWNADYQRKPAYAGFADALSGK